MRSAALPEHWLSCVFRPSSGNVGLWPAERGKQSGGSVGRPSTSGPSPSPSSDRPAVLPVSTAVGKRRLKATPYFSLKPLDGPRGGRRK
jgi:hypothetical protein